MAHIRWRIGGRRRAGGDGEPGLGGRLVGTLFFGFFLAIGLFFVGLIAREAARAAETYQWAERRCEIDQSQVLRSGGEKPYAPQVVFHTVDSGAEAAGTRIRRSPVSEPGWGAAAARIAPYPAGAIVECFVSPRGEAVLERGPLWIGAWALLPLVFVAIGGIGVVAMWRPERRDRFGRRRPEALGQHAPKRGPGRTLAAFGWLVLAIGGVFFWFAAAKPLWNIADARSWHSHACTVEHSSVVSQASDDGTTYRVDILYRWERGRGIERSSRYAFFAAASSGYPGKRAVVRAHPAGAEVPCWVHPTRANEAVLERGFTLEALIALVPAVLLAMGAGLVVAGRRKAARRQCLRAYARRGGAPFAADDPVVDALPAFAVSNGPVTLGTQSSRWGRVFGMACMALFWNGIVGVFVYHAWQSFAAGRPDWFLTLFMLPFVLFGIGFAIAVPYFALALTNARPVVTANTNAPRLGEALELHWSFEGRTTSLERVRFTLRAREEATYQVGTDSRTARETFLETIFVDVPAPACGLGGHARIRIPSASMHSFESKHNKIVWELELVGEIHRWPDIKETYPLAVLPHGVEGLKAREG